MTADELLNLFEEYHGNGQFDFSPHMDLLRNFLNIGVRLLEAC